MGKSIDDLGKAAYRPAWGSLMADVSSQDPSRRGRIMGYLTAGEDAGSVAAPLLASLLWTGFGVPAALLGRIGLALFTEAYMMWLAHRAPLAPNRRGQPSHPSGTSGASAGPGSARRAPLRLTASLIRSGRAEQTGDRAGDILVAEARTGGGAGSGRD